MSIIIKGMDMPQDCWECPMFSTWEEVGIFSCILGVKINDIDTRSTNCPLIEIDDELYEKAVNAYVLQQVRCGNVDNH